MESESGERMLYPKQESGATPDDVRRELSANSNSIEDVTIARAAEFAFDALGATSISRAIDFLRSRLGAMSDAIRLDADPKQLASFIDHARNYTNVMSESVSVVATDHEMLAAMVRRYVSGLQGNLAINQLLTDEFINESRKTDNPGTV